MNVQLAVAPDLDQIRARNRFDRRRASTIAHVMERLDVFAAVAVTQPAHRYDALRREHASAIVNAVLALMKEPEDL
jgi:hypothetical protein